MIKKKQKGGAIKLVLMSILFFLLCVATFCIYLNVFYGNNTYFFTRQKNIKQKLTCVDNKQLPFNLYMCFNPYF